MSSPQNQPPREKKSALDHLFGPNVSQDEFEREFFASILERNDSHADVLRRQAELLARHGDYEGALRLDRRLVELQPDDPIVHYNAACSLAQTGHRVEAICSLTRAIELGYEDFAHIEADADLDGLRDEPSFQELLRRHGISDR
jgi:tetratricopeptide (TPR) repeat protein